MSNEWDLVQAKVEVLKLAESLGNASQACRTKGISRDTFYRWKALYERGGEEALKEASRTKPNLKNRLPEEIEQAVLRMARSQPRFGQQRVARELGIQGVKVSPQGVRAVWLRRGLQTKKLRLMALAAGKRTENVGSTSLVEHVEIIQRAPGEEPLRPGPVLPQRTDTKRCAGNIQGDGMDMPNRFSALGRFRVIFGMRG